MDVAKSDKREAPIHRLDLGDEDDDRWARARAQLNFERSLVEEGRRLRTSVVDVLLEVAAARQRIATTWDRCTESRRGPAAMRYRAMADRARAGVDIALARVAQVAALSIGEPRGS